MTDGIGAVASPVTFYEVGRPANNLEGEVQGVEVAWQHLFDNGMVFSLTIVTEVITSKRIYSDNSIFLV